MTEQMHGEAILLGTTVWQLTEDAHVIRALWASRHWPLDTFLLEKFLFY